VARPIELERQPPLRDRHPDAVVESTNAYFERTRAERLAAQQSMHEKQQREIAHLEKFVERFRAKATKARQAQSRLKALDRMEEIAAAHVDTAIRRVLQAGQMVESHKAAILAALAITVSPSETIGVTISIGGAYAPEWVRSTIELWTERADEQLYRAKSAGRDRVFIEEQRGVAVSADEKGMLFGHLLFGDPASGDAAGSAVTDSEMNRAN